MSDDGSGESPKQDDRTKSHRDSSEVNLALLDSLDGHEFEDVVESLLSKMGFLVEGRQSAADGGIDMIASKENAIVGGRYIIQCKRYSKPIGNAVIRDLYGVVHSESANKGVLITNSTFTSEARRFAEDKQIELIDGAKLQDLLFKYGLLRGGESSSGVRISPGVQLLSAQLVRPFSRTLEESRKVASGVVFLPKEHVDVNRYVRSAQRHMQQIAGIAQTFSAIGNELAATLNDYEPSTEDLASLRAHIKEILNMARALLKIQKEAESVVPPPGLESAHRQHVKIAPAMLRKLWPIAQLARDLTDGKIVEKEVDLHIDLDGSEIWAFNAEIERFNAQNEVQGGCFIATAAYGSALDARIVELRTFRDGYLAPNSFGVTFIKFYERVSPSLAELIEKSEGIRWTVQKLLHPVVALATSLNKLKSQDVFESPGRTDL